MATSSKKRLSVKEETMDKIGAKAKEVGGPELDWSTANYANFKFDATVGVSPDTSIPTEVDAEKADTLEEAEMCPTCEKEPCECEALKEEDEMEVKPEEGDKEVVPAEGDEELMATEADEVEPVATDAAPKEDETMDLDLSDLVDEDEDVVELPSADDEEMIATEADELPMEPAEDETEAEFTPESDETWQDDTTEDDLKVEVADEEEMLPADEMTEGDEEMVPAEGESEEELVSEEDGDEMDAEKKKEDDEMMPVSEGKLKISFKLSETKKLFENNSVLTEEDKRQSRVLFESAVRSVAKQVGAQLYEAYHARFLQVKKLNEQKMAKQLDQYLAYVVEQWAKDNKVALQAQLRNRLTDSFITGLQKLCTEHYIEVPKSRVNVVEALAKNVKSLKHQLKISEAKAVKLHQESRDAVRRERLALRKEHKARVIAEAASAVTPADRGSFVERAHTLKFTTTKEFKKDLVALREQYFRATKSVERPSNEPVAAPLFESKKAVKTSVDAYTQIADRLTGRS